MIQTIKKAWAIPELRKKLVFTALILLIFRIGNAIPVPYVNTELLGDYLNQLSTTVLGLYNVMSGGAFAQATVFALGVQPYINSSIIIQLLTIAIPALERMAREGGEEGKKKIQSITRYATVAIAILQGWGYYALMKSANILTDTGFVTDAAREALAGVDTLLLEANHDVETLQYGPYPYFLKRRILGDEGHLSNDAAAEFARLAVQSGTRDILLAHLSKENNTPELAEYAVARALQSAGLSVRLGVAPRDTMSEVHLCRRSPSFASAN